MKFFISTCWTLLASVAAFAQTPPQFPPEIKHVVIMIQENRTPDNLFHGLTPKCPIPAGASGLNACTPLPVTNSCYDISPCGISNQTGSPTPVTLKAEPLAGSQDPNHGHDGFVFMCDPDPTTFVCRNDAAYLTTSAAACKGVKGACTSYAFVDNVPVTNYDGSKGHLLDPYLAFAKQYGWANFMYQTNQGPSYPAHQFLFSGTSTFTADDDADGIYVSGNFGQIIGNAAGCLLPPTNQKGNPAGKVISSTAAKNPGSDCANYPGNVEECTLNNQIHTVGNEAVGTFCYPHTSMADVLDGANVSWKYYAPSPGSIWTSPDSFQKICVPEYVTVNGKRTLQCTGPEWKAHVDADNETGANNRGTEILHDIDSCNLADVSWVIPDGAWSDHAGKIDKYGPSWVAAVINEIGNNPLCGPTTRNAGEKLWNSTAIVVTWDDWGGWSDNQPAQYLSQLPCGTAPCLGDYQYGFRVPLLVVSAWTPPTISNVPYDFGSILRFVEGVYQGRGLNVTEGQLGFADARAKSDLKEFFTRTFTAPRPYKTVPAQYKAVCFTETVKSPGCFPVGPPTDPDDK